MLLPYFIFPSKFNNISINAKKKAQIDLPLNIDHPYLYVTNRASKKEVIGYIDLQSQLFICTLNNITGKQKNPNDEFRRHARITAEKLVTDFIINMKELYDENPEEYDKKYKPVKQLNQELSEYLEYPYEFYRNLQKQLDLVSPKQLPNINEYLRFKDDTMNDDIYVTKQLPYLNPKNQILTDEQKQVVDKFLDAFLDEYNKKKLVWYFGAILSNVDMKDANISKAMIVTSNTGGTGKSTLINSLAKGLLEPEYMQLYSGFDNYFNSNDKFATSSLSPCRLHVFAEAKFSGTMSDKDHDFTGLDESNIKAWITEGLITTEEKYQPRKITELSGMAIILTNTPPVIAASKKELTRRFISVVIKSSDMVTDKAKALDMNEHEIYQYVQSNAQAFANYFVSFYQVNPVRYQSLCYDFDEIQSDISESNDVESQHEQDFKSDILQLNYNTALQRIASKYNMDISSLLEQLNYESNIVRFDNEHNYLYIKSSKDIFKRLDLIPFRQVLIDIYGSPIVKFHTRVFQIPLNI